MNNETIITIVFTFIISGIISPFSKVFFEKILKNYNPDINKYKAYLKFSILFTIRYLFPLFNIIFILKTSDGVDMFFVITIIVCSMTLTINIVLDVIKRVERQAIKDIIEHDKVFKQLIEVAINHSEMMSEIVKTIKDIKENKIP